MAKKYYWLKLKDDFFRQKQIKKLRKIAGGDTYTIIYLKMLLLSLQHEGKLYFEGVEDDFSEEIALEIDEESENVKVTMLFLLKNNLIKEVSTDEFFMNSVPKMVGKESESAERTRRYRERKNLIESKTSQCDGDVTLCDTEQEQEIEQEIEKEQQQEQKSKHVVVVELKNKIENIINSKITIKGVNSLLEKSSLETINYYLDNWDKFKNRNKENVTGYFINAVIDKYNIPKEEKGKSKPVQSTNYEQRKYDDDFFNNLYDNIKYIK